MKKGKDKIAGIQKRLNKSRYLYSDFSKEDSLLHVHTHTCSHDIHPSQEEREPATTTIYVGFDHLFFFAGREDNEFTDTP